MKGSTGDEGEKAMLKTEEDGAIVKTNYLSTSKALKYRSDLSKPSKNESPVIKSLFEFKENEGFKSPDKPV